MSWVSLKRLINIFFQGVREEEEKEEEEGVGWGDEAGRPNALAKRV